MNNAIEQQAMELAIQHTLEMQKELIKLQDKMIEAGMNPNDYEISHNRNEIIEGKTLEFKCWAVKKGE
jgi:hypothetical protein